MLRLLLPVLIATLPVTFGVRYVPASGLNNKTFPQPFFFGVASSAYQVEGAWNEDGKGENTWDYFIHKNPDVIANGDNAEIACDSYHLYALDIENMRELGVDFYRFSISWTRIIPNGFPTEINQKGIDYYNTFINALIRNNISPMITMYHFDLPEKLEEIGGWLNPYVADYFVEYAKVLFENFGDRVPYWITINEPRNPALGGYGGTYQPPALDASGIGDYQAATNLLKAHARVWHLYDEVYRPKYNGQIAICLDTTFVFTEDDSPNDLIAQEREMDFQLGWFANPIFGPNGNFPQTMIDRIAERSKLEGFSTSRLPAFTDEEIEYIKGTSDFFGINYYSAFMVQYTDDYGIGQPGYYNDKSTNTYARDEWEASPVVEWQEIVPEGMRALLNWIKDKYGNPNIFITENGFGDAGGLDDKQRVNYYKTHLSAVLDAIYEDGVPVFGYTAWSLMDNFEWMSGYKDKFGLYSVDFNDDSRPRTPKASAAYFKQVIATQCVLEESDGICEE